MKQKSFYPLVYILIGAVIGALTVYFSMRCCTTKPVEPKPEPDSIAVTGFRTIDTVTANQYFLAYYKNLKPDSLFGFTINSRQFTVMQRIADSLPDVHGFRIYMGLDNGTPVRMVVGTGSPDKTRLIYVTTDEASGPCPDNCDTESPIIRR